VSSNKPSQLDDVKHTILTCIYENPGIRYREILKLTGLSNGVLEYHLKELETSYEIINVDRRVKQRGILLHAFQVRNPKFWDI
jgi:predicted transcriptional regulator